MRKKSFNIYHVLTGCNICLLITSRALCSVLRLHQFAFNLPAFNMSSDCYIFRSSLCSVCHRGNTTDTLNWSKSVVFCFFFSFLSALSLKLKESWISVVCFPFHYCLTSWVRGMFCSKGLQNVKQITVRSVTIIGGYSDCWNHSISIINCLLIFLSNVSLKCICFRVVTNNFSFSHVSLILWLRWKRIVVHFCL